MAFDLKTFKTRSITAIVFVIVLLSCIYYSYYTFLCLFFFVGMWGLYEFYLLAERIGYRAFATIGMISGVISFMSIYAWQLPANCTDTILLRYAIFLVPFLIAMRFVFSNSDKALQELAFTIGGVFYCIVPFALLVQIPTHEASSVTELEANYDYFKVMGIIFLIWANDTFAYLGGSMVGKNKLFERVSPGKTWEGTIIGILFCVGVGFMLNMNETFANKWVWPMIALFVGVFGTIGDLVESLMKRKAGVKDSGTIMPGHGGVLDRFDSLLFVSPFVFVILKLVEETH